MGDYVSRPRNNEELWEKMVIAARRGREEVKDDPYFAGIYEGLMYALAEMSSCWGKQKEYVSLCKEFDDVFTSPWLAEEWLW